MPLAVDKRAFVAALAKSKSREQRDIIIADLDQTRLELGRRDLPSKDVAEFMVKCMHYVLIWGMDVSFCHVAAINLTQSAATIYEKRIGYLAVELFITDSDDVLLLLVNGLQRDLQSESPLEINMALTAITSLANQDMAPALLPHIEACLVHEMELVRRKSVLAISRLYNVAPDVVIPAFAHLKKPLADSEPAVMSAALVLFRQFARDYPQKCRSLTSAFLHILIQILDGRLPNGFDYHGISAPWAIMQCVEILGYLAQGDIKTSDKVRGVLVEILKQHRSGDNASFGIVLACVQALAKATPPQATLTDEAELYTDLLKRYLAPSQNTNLMYLGITILQALLSSHPNVVAAFKDYILACLEHPDSALGSKTLDLVYALSTPSSLPETLSILMTALQTASPHRQLDLIDKIINLTTSQLAVTRISTFLDVFIVVDDKICRPRLTEPITSLLVADTEGVVKKRAVETCFKKLADNKEKNVEYYLGKLFVWVIGEYCHTSSLSTSELLHALVAVLRDGEDNGLTSQIIESITKIVTRSHTCPPEVIRSVSNLRTLKDLDIQQRLVGFNEATRNIESNINREALTIDLVL
ncbi:hypothetical protein SeMB42_g02404 [Synchytrium endobioticum]|uniref:Clathrin/coatomer adaptor adaptin-like N-terminal domain-containing protein n=1 Tax=Synchytrium endobioticum TaxID=286115 RepID=A0A507CMN5_9FUNG|nr:hypothetical protein SeLEV6574_g06903 [Synchytrium endobioticum]TPX50026.1 hypothetical protein SeMB42_g02404 [Synchytrium endobioticum]